MATAIDRHELQRLIDHGDAQLVDVLPEPEYTRSHIPGTIGLPLKRLTVETAAVRRRDKPVVVY